MKLTNTDFIAYKATTSGSKWNILVQLNGRGTTGVKMILHNIKADSEDKAIDKVKRILKDITFE